HDGSLSTGHANSARDMLTRIETMVLMAMDLPLSAIRRQIASAVDIIIHLGRLRDKTRKVLEICEITGMNGSEIMIEPVYQFVETGDRRGRKVEGVLKKTGELKNIEKLQKKGFG
ncbi:MAG: Flp pilus assembly complex ATPase component TadA, partial [Lachnospiraceae bacterium]|nr:Flp pilus assembly complex ATPase component TadA [Lachnospiraceae bacterium]